MIERVVRVIVSAAFFASLLSVGIPGIVCAAQEEILMGTVVKQGKRFIIEAEDGDYVVRGIDVSKMAGKLVEATGIITESDKEDIIEVKAIEEVQNTLPD
jgi:hypothetical protein